MGNILAIISNEATPSRVFIEKLKRERVDIEKIYCFSEDKIDNDAITAEFPVEYLHLDHDNINSKNLDLTILLGHSIIDSSLIEALQKTSKTIIGSSYNFENIDGLPIVDMNLNPDELKTIGAIIVSPMAQTMMLAPIIKSSKEHYGLSSVVSTVLLSKDDTEAVYYNIDGDNVSAGERIIEKELRSILNESSVPMTIMTLPGENDYSYATLNVELNNDFIVKDIDMFAKKFDNISIDSFTRPEELLDGSLKEKYRENILVTRTRVNDNAEHGYSTNITIINSGLLEINNILGIATTILE